MALSEKEQKLLEQMEAALAAEDPRLVNTLRGTTDRRVRKRRSMLAGFAFLLGLGALIGGLASYWWVSVIGFVIMTVAAVVAIYSWQQIDSAPTSAGPADSRTKNPAGFQSSQSFMDRMEERWRRRRDEEF